MAEVTIRKIPAHIVYSAEYDIEDFMDFFDPETEANQLYDLQLEMEADNPDVIVPEIGEDYNYFQYPVRRNEDGTMHVVYCDMTDKVGKDSPKGSYHFVEVPEVTAACLMHKGPFNSFEEGFDELFDWLKNNGYETEGKGRISAINGPWDTESEEDYVNECQIIIKAD